MGQRIVGWTAVEQCYNDARPDGEMAGEHYFGEEGGGEADALGGWFQVRRTGSMVARQEKEVICQRGGTR